MKKVLARGGIEFLAVLLGITMSFNVDEWKQDKEIEKRLKSDYINIQKDLRKDIVLLERVLAVQQESFESGLKALEMIKNKEKFDYKKFINNLSNVRSLVNDWKFFIYRRIFGKYCRFSYADCFGSISHYY